MNLENLREKHQVLLDHMRADHYAESYVCRIEKTIRQILTLHGNSDIQSYQDVYLAYVNEGRNKLALKRYKSQIGVIHNFDVNGLYPNRINRQTFLQTSNYYTLIPHFKKFVDDYRTEAGKTSKKATTIQGESRNVSSFLAFMQKKGATSLAAVDQKMVIGYFTDENGYPNKSYSLKKQMTAVFKTCSLLYPNGECERILSYLPKLKKRRKNIPHLTDTEAAAIKSALTDPDSPLTLRDRAIGLLALETGLRCCDIAGLTLSSINWERDLISITQQKTEYPLEIPLPTYCGNALDDYIHRERPETDANEIFIRANLPYVRLESRSLTRIAALVAQAAGVRQNPGDKRGFHLYRHRIATAMLGNNIQDAVISKALGHASPESLETYLGTDFVHLKECALSVEDYPVDLEVVLK